MDVIGFELDLIGFEVDRMVLQGFVDKPTPLC